MITDHLTNTVFLSDWLSKECPELYQSLTKALRDNTVEYRILSNTNDIWCRDYMPIQTDEKRFVSYKYYPDYLVKEHKEHYITDVKDVGNMDFLHQAEVVTLDLVLDGGNVVKCGNKMVMTEKVFVENKEKSRNEVQRLPSTICRLAIWCSSRSWESLRMNKHFNRLLRRCRCAKSLAYRHWKPYAMAAH